MGLISVQVALQALLDRTAALSVCVRMMASVILGMAVVRVSLVS